MAETIGQVQLGIGLDNSGISGGISSLQGMFSGLGGKLTAAAGLAVVSGALASIGTSAYNTFRDLDEGMRKIRTLGVSENEITILKRDLIELSTQLPLSLPALMEASYQGLSAGVSYADLMGVVTAAGRAAVGGFTDIETAMDGITTVLNAYGLSAGEAYKVTDDLITTQNEGKTTVGELATALGAVVPLAASLGISFPEVAAAIATVTMQGQSTSEAITGIKAAIQQVLNPSSEMQTAANALGLSLGETALKSQGLVGWLGDMRDKIAASNGTITATDLFKGSTEALNGVSALLSGNMETLNGKLATYQENTGAAYTASELMVGSTNSQWQILSNNFNPAMAGLGELLALAVNPAMGRFSELIQGLNTAAGNEEKSVFGRIWDGMKVIGDFMDPMSGYLKNWETHKKQLEDVEALYGESFVVDMSFTINGHTFNVPGEKSIVDNVSEKLTAMDGAAFKTGLEISDPNNQYAPWSEFEGVAESAKGLDGKTILSEAAIEFQKENLDEWNKFDSSAKAMNGSEIKAKANVDPDPAKLIITELETKFQALKNTDITAIAGLNESEVKTKLSELSTAISSRRAEFQTNLLLEPNAKNKAVFEAIDDLGRKVKADAVIMDASLKLKPALSAAAVTELGLAVEKEAKDLKDSVKLNFYDQINLMTASMTETINGAFSNEIKTALNNFLRGDGVDFLAMATNMQNAVLSGFSEQVTNKITDWATNTFGTAGVGMLGAAVVGFGLLWQAFGSSSSGPIETAAQKFKDGMIQKAQEFWQTFRDEANEILSGIFTGEGGEGGGGGGSAAWAEYFKSVFAGLGTAIFEGIDADELTALYNQIKSKSGPAGGKIMASVKVMDTVQQGIKEQQDYFRIQVETQLSSFRDQGKISNDQYSEALSKYGEYATQVSAQLEPMLRDAMDRLLQGDATAITRLSQEINMLFNIQKFLDTMDYSVFGNILSHAKGAYNIPRDNYLANLHAGEMVVPADIARDIRSMGLINSSFSGLNFPQASYSQGGIVVNISGNHLASDLDIDRLADRVGNAVMEKVACSRMVF